MNATKWLKYLMLGLGILTTGCDKKKEFGPGCVYYANGEAIRFRGNSTLAEKANQLPTEPNDGDQANLVTVERGLMGYWIDLELGTDTIAALIDTGSSDLVIMGDKNACPDCKVAMDGGVYRPSSEAIDTEKTISLSYGGGKHRGTAEVFKDKHGLTCGDPENPLKAEFGVWTQATNVLNILGLAYSNIAKMEPFFDHLVEDYGFKNIFSMALCGEKEGSAIVLGDALQNLSEKRMEFTRIINDGFYSVHTKYLYVYDWQRDDSGNWAQVPGARTRLGTFPAYRRDKPGEPAIRSIVDSGSTRTYLPKHLYDEVNSLMQHIGEEQGVNPNFWSNENPGKISLQWLSENQISAFPSFGISFVGALGLDFVLKIPNTKYIKSSGYLRSYYAFAKSRNASSILGMNFMENFLILFDRENKQLGFAPNTGYCAK